MKKSDQKDEDFARLIRVLQDDADFRKKIISILKLDPFNRKSVLNTVLTKMALNNEPRRIIEAYSLLTDDEVARKTICFLNDQDEDINSCPNSN